MERLEEEHSGATIVATQSMSGINSRIVYINGKHKYMSNVIDTAKYNFITFMPKFLFQQFRRYSNIFFLMIALLQQIPNVSPTGRFTTAVPLFCILFVSAVKEIFEDIKRHATDRGVNRSLALVLNKVNGIWERKHWQDIQVGDVIKCTNEQFFPSDLLLLASSEPNGMCYIETANLDGETNLKVRQSLAATFHCVTSELLINDLSMASIECEPPNKHLYEFHGNLKINDIIYPINPDQILLRGAKLKNTNWVFGCVLYTGHETKLMMNSMLQAPMKQSRVEKTTNTQILLLFGILLLIGAISTIFSMVWSANNQHWYIGKTDDLSTNFAFTFLTFIILYNNLIPISLQVSLEVVRFFQAQFINSDLEMYCEENDTPAVARTSNLNEELGQVKYVLSDKTGTLTRNVMEFKQCSIAGTVFKENEFSRIVDQLKTSQANASYVREFLTLLAVCHTVVPEKSDDPKDKGIRYQSASPDEGALVSGARKIGFEFTTRTPNYVLINALDKEEKFEILNVLEFNSDRKRMSVIVRTEDNKIKLYIKGADTVIYERLSEDRFASITVEHLEQFASQGLRTLCCGYVTISETAYQQWSKEYQSSLTSTLNSKENSIDDVMEKIEKNIILLGATAIEDKLQDGVPEAIATLLKAGMKVWVLTGDKQETAINIGYSCKLLNRTNTLLVINEESLDATAEAIREAETTSDTVLVIDGASLRYALSSNLKRDFMEISLVCQAVICCRVSPIQKAEIVELVKSTTKQVTLAIGDGANDVAMIRSANVGVGISGLEGLQAAHSADYSISQFRFLTRLLLVHGSWSLARLCKLILYSFYKNIALYVIELWFATVSAWSGQTIFERWTIGLYNVIFTMAPPLAIGLFDRQCSAEIMMKYPALYKQNTQTDGGYLVFGNILYTYVVITVCLKAGIESCAWNWITHASIWGSIASWFIFLMIYSNFWPTLPLAADMVAMNKFIFSTGVFWSGLFLIPFTTVLVDLVYKVVTRTCYKTLADQITEMEVSTSPSQTILTETARLIRHVFDTTKRGKRQRRRKNDSEVELQHGYAFSQEEHGAVRQSQLIRVYDSTKAKPSGV
ncbi:putative phospholipid-transporting ATPase IA-like protein [Leptotrombidium deliense]|uniref:Phospholipid-transporting ATPase n=1 Tax=Leptotrombidium deliense TaxID=299467 RepID=A0A443SPV5_9ACAR|nr:putative phospholipid-transporting ATPase IA-like protein [Leptotrombidium deliense]